MRAFLAFKIRSVCKRLDFHLGFRWFYILLNAKNLLIKMQVKARNVNYYNTKFVEQFVCESAWSLHYLQCFVRAAPKMETIKSKA